MKRPSWPLVLVSIGVLAAHLMGLMWWLGVPLVAGQAVWSWVGPTAKPSTQSSDRQPRQLSATPVRVTVVSALSLASPRQPPVPPVPLKPSRDQAPSPAQTALPHPVEPSPTAAPQPGTEQAWAPSPSAYLAAEQVDVFPRPVDEWQLDWTQVPRRQPGWQVTVRLWVSAAGLIDHVVVLDASPPGAWAGRLLAGLPRTVMRPGMLAGQPVPVTYVVLLAPDQLP